VANPASNAPNYGDKIVGAIARGAFIYLEGQKDAWLNAAHGLTGNLIDTTAKIIQNNFPRTSIIERSFEGPLMSLLNNSKPEIISSVDSFLDSTFQQGLTALDTRAKASNS